MLFRLPVICLLAILSACSTGKKPVTTRPGIIEAISADIAVDSINQFFGERYTVTRMIEPKELQGRWNVTMMHRREYVVPERLTGVSLSFADSVFAGNAPCNSIAGDFAMKGTGIRFFNIISTKMSCDKLEQETVLLQLLENTVKIVSLDRNRLLLKDKVGNNLFECIRD